MDASALDQMLRLLAAAAIGIIIGFNRELRSKPLGMRTLALVSLGSAAAAVAALNVDGIFASPEATARVIQGILTGVLTGVGFIGAGTVLRDQNEGTVHGLTTAATVWIAAALGIACALAAWLIVAVGLVVALSILFGLGWLERKLMLKAGGTQ